MVEHVLRVPEEEGLFNGIVAATANGLRLVNHLQIDEMTTVHVRSSLADEQVASLPAPNGNPVYSGGLLQDTEELLHDRFGRLFQPR